MSWSLPGLPYAPNTRRDDARPLWPQGVSNVRFESMRDEQSMCMVHRLSWLFNGRAYSRTLRVPHTYQAHQEILIDPLSHLFGTDAQRDEDLERAEHLAEGLATQVRSLAAALAQCQALLAAHKIPIPGVTGVGDVPTPSTNQE